MTNITCSSTCIITCIGASLVSVQYSVRVRMHYVASLVTSSTSKLRLVDANVLCVRVRVRVRFFLIGILFVTSAVAERRTVYQPEAGLEPVWS